jgi:hypothetical protein
MAQHSHIVNLWMPWHLPYGCLATTPTIALYTWCPSKDMDIHALTA